MDFQSLRKDQGFPDSSVGKESTCNAGDPSSKEDMLGQEDMLEKGVGSLSLCPSTEPG